MTQPQPGTLDYLITKRIPVDALAGGHDEAHIIITDGTTAKIYHRNVSSSADLSSLSHAVLLQLWNIGTVVPMKRWRTAMQKRDDTIITDTVDTLLRVLAGSATPSVDAVFTAARNVLVEADKLDDWSKLNTLLQDMDETKLRQFLAFIILILLNQSAGE